MRDRALAVIAVLLAFIVVATSCNGDGNDTGTTPPDPPTTEASVAPETTDTGTTTEPPATTTTPEEVLACSIPAADQQLTELVDYITVQIMADYQIRNHDQAWRDINCWHDWSTDDCSVPIGKDTSVAQDFIHPCHRHDFGYRNYKRIERDNAIDVWTEEQKLIVDDRFLGDTREVCSSRSWWQKQVCFGWAQMFYWAVRAFGGFNDDALDS